MRCSDVICDFPLKEMLAFHKKTGAEGTILVTQVWLLAASTSSGACSPQAQTSVQRMPTPSAAWGTVHRPAGAMQCRAPPCKVRRPACGGGASGEARDGTRCVIVPLKRGPCQSQITITAQVEDPSKYGVVVTDESSRVERFVEKPKVTER